MRQRVIAKTGRGVKPAPRYLAGVLLRATVDLNAVVSRSTSLFKVLCLRFPFGSGYNVACTRSIRSYHINRITRVGPSRTLPHSTAIKPSRPLKNQAFAGCRVERSAPCCRVRPLGLRLPSKRASPFFGGYPSSNRTCRFPAYGSPCGTGFISFAPLRPSAPFHIDSDGCSSIWTSGFRRAAT